MLVPLTQYCLPQRLFFDYGTALARACAPLPPEVPYTIRLQHLSFHSVLIAWAVILLLYMVAMWLGLWELFPRIFYAMHAFMFGIQAALYHELGYAPVAYTTFFVCALLPVLQMLYSIGYCVTKDIEKIRLPDYHTSIYASLFAFSLGGMILLTANVQP